MGMKPSHPGSFVRHDIVEHHGLTVAQAAEALGVRRATLSDLINERSGLSPEMALRLEKVFGVSMDMMLRIQAAWDADVMRARFKETAFKAFTPVT
ncbi:MAG: HigA family addiction module antitoxin [Hyphomicrobiales bacterium]|nr:HigA family addiction module antitoxin [Hyphomicrobiales bacterium]